MARKVFVTGGTGGLGKSVVTALLENEMQVVLLIRNENDVKALDDLWTDYKSAISYVLGDMLDAVAISKAAMEHPDVYGLVHIAGGFDTANQIADSTEEQFNKMIALNLKSAWLLFQQFLPILKENGKGSIVTIGAKPADLPGAENAVYAASKAGLINLTRTIANEGKHHGVRANCILPGVIDTPANRSWGSDDQIKKWTTPEEIAEVVVFLIQDKSAGVNDTQFRMYGEI